MRRCLHWASLCSVLALWPALCGAQTEQTYDYLGITTKIVIGASGDVQSNFDQVLKIVGLPSVSGGASSALGIDSSGNVRKDPGTTIDTSGHWLFGASVTGPFQIAGGSAADTALGFDNVRCYMNTTPRCTFEDAGFSQWTMDNFGGTLRFFRSNSSGTADEVPLAISDNLTITPLGHTVLPSQAFGFDIGTFLLPIGALHVGELWANSFVAQETIATIGGSIEVAPTTTLIEGISSSSTTIKTKHNNLANGARAFLKQDFRQEMLGVTSGPTKINVCTVNCDADSTTNWAGFGGTIATAPNQHVQGQYSILYTPTGGPPNTIAHTTATDFAASTQYTVSIYVKRSDAAAVVPSVSAYRFLCGDGVTIWNATAAVEAGSGWYRLYTTCTSPASPTGVVGVTSIPTAGGVTHFFDAVQIEAGSTLTPWSLTSSSYTVTRDLDGSGANSWDAGAAIVDTSVSFIDIFSTHGLKSTSEIGPTIVGNVRLSSTWNDWAPRWACGQLNGLYGYASSTFGCAFGDSTTTWVTANATDGFMIKNGSTVKLQASVAGTLSLVEGAVTLDNLGIRIQNTTSSSSEAKAYTFYGSVTHAKRPGLYYTESGGSSDFSMGNDAGTITINPSSTLSLTAAAGASQISLGSNLAVTASGNLNIALSGTLNINGSPGATSTASCGAGQHVSSWIIVAGWVVQLTCS